MSESASFKELTRDCVADLIPYKGGKPASDLRREMGVEEVLKFASNESPLGPSPLAIEAMEKAARETNRYPDSGCYYLREKLAGRMGLSMEEIVVGSGSNELVNLAMCTVVDPGDEVIIADPSFIMYAIAVKTMAGIPVFVPTVDFAHDLKAMAARVGPRTKAVFVCNPNNPTGAVIRKREVGEFMASVPERVLIVFDEAYYEYITDPEYPETLQYVREGRNVLVLRTFSKVYSLAGLRVGYGIAKPEIIEYFNRVRLPFNVTNVAQAAAMASLDDPEQVSRSIRVNREGMEYLTRELRRLGMGVTESYTNFLLVDLRRDGMEVSKRLEGMGLIVRPMKAFRLPDRYVRITVGLPSENERLIQGLERICASGVGGPKT